MLKEDNAEDKKWLEMKEHETMKEHEKLREKKTENWKWKNRKLRVKCVVCIAHIILMCVLMKIVSKSIEQII